MVAILGLLIIGPWQAGLGRGAILLVTVVPPFPRGRSVPSIMFTARWASVMLNNTVAVNSIKTNFGVLTRE